MARSGLFHVPGDECRQAEGRRALCFDLQPQFRRPPGPRRSHASGLACNGCCCCCYRAPDGRADALMLRRHLPSLAFAMTSLAITSTAKAVEVCEPIKPSEIDAQWKHYSSLSGVQPTEGGYELYECISIESTLQIVC